MLTTIPRLQGVSVLSKEDQKKIKGRGMCGIKVNGEWCMVPDMDHDGHTKDDAQSILGTQVSCGDNIGTATNWCCDSCWWNN